MNEEDVAKTLIRLIEERPTKRWYLKKDHFPTTISWEELVNAVKRNGYNVEDQGTVVKGWL